LADMTESDDNGATKPEGINQTPPALGPPTFATVAMAVGVGYILTLFLFGLIGVVFAIPACFIVLAGVVSAAVGLADKRNRRGPYRRRHLAVFAVSLALALYLLPGLGTIRTLNLHCRMRVAVTGGQEELQSWALELMAKPRDQIEVSAWSDKGAYEWTVQKQHWSRQVRRLNPKRIRIERPLGNDREIVHLLYGGGFLHWSIGVGQPKAIDDLAVEVKAADCVWFRWSDGTSCWFN